MISVIVLVSGDEHSGESLESLAGQTHTDFEAIVVHDGPLTVDLPDERFRALPGSGLSRGAAREVGVRAAKGEFLFFVDSGDRTPADALELLHTALAGSRSDFAAGNVALITESGGVWRSWLHKGPFASRKRATTLAKSPGLRADRIATAKLFRRSFWDAAGLRFPETDRLPDLPVAVSAYQLASAIEIVPDFTVERRAPLQPPPSTDPADAAEAFAAVAAIRGRLEGRWKPKLRRSLERSLLDRELRAFLDALPDADPAARARTVELAAEFVETIEPRVLQELGALSRLKWHLASRRLVTELVKVVRYERGGANPSIVRDGLRRYVVYPYWKDDALGVPAKVYLAGPEVRMRGRVEEISWKDGKLAVSGQADIASVSMRRRWASAKGVTLRQGRRRIRLRARQSQRRKAWRGIEFTVDPAKLRRRGGWKDGVWQVHAWVFADGLLRSGPLKSGSTGSGLYPPYGYVADDVRIVPEMVDKRLRLRVETVRVKVTGLRWDGDALEVTGVAPAPGKKAAKKGGRLTLVRGDQTAAFDVTAGGSGGFTARIALADLPDVRPDETKLDDTVAWQFHVDGVRAVLAEDVEPEQRLWGEREAIAGRNASGYAQLSVRTARYVVETAELDGEGVLTLRGAHPVHRDGTVVLRSRGRKLDLSFPMTRGETVVPLTRIKSLAGTLPLRAGRWDVLFRHGEGRPLAVRLVDEAALPEPVEVEYRQYSVESQGGRVVLEVGSNIRAEEQGAATRMRQEARLKVKEEGLRDAVLFSCFNGRQYSDSTKAIHEELVRRGSTLEQLWVVGDAQVELPPTAKAVRLNGRDWHEAVHSSRYIVTNHRIGDWFRRHPDQTVLQTWHGTPLKKVGRDVKEVHFAYAPGMQKAHAATVGEVKLPEWTHLVSPNPFSTKILSRAFKYEGEIIEAGYPRNDVLYSPDADAIAASVRERLEIPEGKKVVLYAPTWRDDQFYGAGRYKADWNIDLDLFGRELGDDHVLVARLHPNVVDGAPDAPFVRDASLYPDIAELYLAADVLVSDYSSVMFDFANLRRPMLFYTYDLAHYRDKLRGFYFDFETESPGPLLETTQSLIDALKNLDEVAAKYQSPYEAFHTRFCSLEDGHAASRVVDQLFGKP
ncbi:bifunctional glycosyltransferase family 2 protein/CDP-glycerol:glycerophosphate glycerophosphotransferase [Actinocorallia sp. A-T 12471]|uniref:bifunctional glycosyltransferase/CDP-glycerol:glycerophosphate glycerophosphotransferase n=1 Tax=Actinocorallia sp. A-T 12471 TaxID=3089813 RepID=UPI0029D227FB|nr:bifunctional glycosyltransferase family 2 protein/CDP-glycerol:glycerophosphate glycerophosphotransferase [Actinocorallia sp. A-T 12471]MDX6744640.1 bifunctional glycosyltransferase family 2 protein/CDP-glycerol:glycerophosphate glycerophosphotransferase [Actinocorallia sp. A-T 12471]